MTDYDKLNQIMSQNSGYIRTADAAAAGVSRVSLGAFVRKNELDRMAHGLYLSPDAWRDSLFEIQMRYPRVIFSHETALYYLALSEREPLQHSLTMATSMGVTRLRDEGAKVYRIRDELFEVGLSEVKSSLGNTLRCYDAERTICDILRYKKSTDIQDLQVALNSYFRSGKRDFGKLLRYAELFSVEKIVRQYLEVLLP